MITRAIGSGVGGAGCLVLLLASGPAGAQGPGAPAGPSAVEVPAGEEIEEIEVPETTQTPVHQATVVEPEPPAAPPEVTAAAAALEAAWEGVVGYDVVLELNSGGTLQGRVSALQTDTFTFIDYEAGGMIRVMPRASVRGLRVRLEVGAQGTTAGGPPARRDRSEPVPEHRRGERMIGGGVALLLLGTPLLISGAVLTDTDAGLPMLLAGAPMVLGGIILTAAGSRKQRRARQSAVVIPQTGMTRRGTWTGGLTVAF